MGLGHSGETQVSIMVKKLEALGLPGGLDAQSTGTLPKATGKGPQCGVE